MSQNKSAKTNKNKKNKKADNKAREWAGLIIITIAAFTFVAVYTDAAGIIGSYWRNLWFGAAGIASYILPVFITLTGIALAFEMDKRVNYRRLSIFVFLCFTILSIVQIWFLPKHLNANEPFAAYISKGIDQGILGKGTGLIGSVAAFVLIKLFGIAGSYVVAISALLLSILALADVSVKDIWDYLSKKKIVAEEPQMAGGDKAIDYDSDKTTKGDDKRQEQPSTSGPSDIKIVAFQQKSEELISVGHPSRAISDAAYKFPSLDLLSKPKNDHPKSNKDDVLNNAKLLEETLDSFGINAKVLQVTVGPAITRYELQPGHGVKVSSITHLADDIALNLAVPEVRIEAPIPGKAALGIEVPNANISPVLLREVLESKEFISHPSKLAFALGKDIAGRNVIGDLSTMPHLLIAGATGSGKSVCINAIITSILYKATPKEVKMLMIDPKVVELSLYNGIPHLLIPVVTDPKKAAAALIWAVQEMTSRYKLFADKGSRDIFRYNEMVAPEEILPQIVVIIDELSDLMMVAPGEVEDAICRLAQMARAAGIYLVIATQRPSVDVITGVIKANIPSRIAFAVSSQVDSRTILDSGGAEKLLGRGDMLYYPLGAAKPVRVQGAYISEKEVERIVSAVKDAQPTYDMTIMDEISASAQNGGNDNESYEDELFKTALETVVQYKQASVSFLQKRLRIGYVRAARIIDEMEARGYIGPYDGAKPRQVLITEEQLNEIIKQEVN